MKHLKLATTAAVVLADGIWLMQPAQLRNKHKALQSSVPSVANSAVRDTVMVTSYSTVASSL